MFESLDVPVFHDADVVIAGAGPAGIGAAIASAMQGRKTVLLEPVSYTHLGYRRFQLGDGKFPLTYHPITLIARKKA